MTEMEIDELPEVILKRVLAESEDHKEKKIDSFTTFLVYEAMKEYHKIMKENNL